MTNVELARCVQNLSLSLPEGEPQHDLELLAEHLSRNDHLLKKYGDVVGIARLVTHYNGDGLPSLAMQKLRAAVEAVGKDDVNVKPIDLLIELDKRVKAIEETEPQRIRMQSEKVYEFLFPMMEAQDRLRVDSQREGEERAPSIVNESIRSVLRDNPYKPGSVRWKTWGDAVLRVRAAVKNGVG